MRNTPKNNDHRPNLNSVGKKAGAPAGEPAGNPPSGPSGVSSPSRPNFKGATTEVHISDELPNGLVIPGATLRKFAEEHPDVYEYREGVGLIANMDMTLPGVVKNDETRADLQPSIEELIAFDPGKPDEGFTVYENGFHRPPTVSETPQPSTQDIVMQINGKIMADHTPIIHRNYSAEADVAIQDIAEHVRHLRAAIEDLVPPGRHKSLAITALEDVALRAEAGILQPAVANERMPINPESQAAKGYDHA